MALLMTAGALAYPLYIDIRRHGSDNILRKTLQDIEGWGPIATFIQAVQALLRAVMRAIKVSISMSVIASVAWLAYELWTRFFK